MLPSTAPVNGPRPRLAITIRPASASLAMSAIVCASSPKSVSRITIEVSMPDCESCSTRALSVSSIAVSSA